MTFDEATARIALAIDKALTRPEILPYMKEQVIRDTIRHLDEITDDEIKVYLDAKKVSS